MLARYLRWLKDESSLEVRDRETDQTRPVEFGDIAVLAQTTTNLPLLFRAMERFGIPYAARGATLFLREPVIRQLILGLRAVADESDGIAQAAFFRPPFFALDLADIIAGRLEEDDIRRSPARPSSSSTSSWPGKAWTSTAPRPASGSGSIRPSRWIRPLPSQESPSWS